jgi:hypothetical protein
MASNYQSCHHYVAVGFEFRLVNCNFPFELWLNSELFTSSLLPKPRYELPVCVIRICRNYAFVKAKCVPHVLSSLLLEGRVSKRGFLALMQ